MAIFESSDRSSFILSDCSSKVARVALIALRAAQRLPGRDFDRGWSRRTLNDLLAERGRRRASVTFGCHLADFLIEEGNGRGRFAPRSATIAVNVQ